MDSVAISERTDRQALFGETGAALGVADAIIEKDFWVCWTLKRLFEGSSFLPMLGSRICALTIVRWRR
jgi:hypothetical protein